MLNKYYIIITIFICILVASCSSYVEKIVTTPSNKQPNIIFILVDDMGYGELGSYGQTKIRTPNLDEMAEQGMKFDQFYAGSTVCAPSRASLMTGLHTGHTQIRGNYELGSFLDSEEFGQEPLHPGTQTLGTVLQSAGYQTALIGKWGLGGPGSYGEPNKQGFDYFYGYLDQKQAHNQTPSHLWRNKEWQALNNSYLDSHPVLPDSFDVTDKDSFSAYTGTDFSQERLTEDALKYIAKAKDKPFFLYLAYTMPHAALQAPKEEIAKYNFVNDVYTKETNKGNYIPAFKPRATRAAMVSLIDKNVGQVLTALKKQGLTDNTLVIFTSDNGPSEEGGADINFFNATGGLRGKKRDLYEGGIRMPMLALWPGKVPAKSQTQHISSFWDILPTLAELAKAQTNQTLDGISFLPTLLQQAGQKNHEYLYWEFHSWDGNHKQAIRYGKWKGVMHFVKDNNDSNIKNFELFDIRKDLSESNNIAEQHPNLSSKLQQMMEESRTQSYMNSWNFDY